MPHFLEILGDPYLGGNGPGNEACLAAIRAQNSGLPDWWWVGRNLPMVFQESWANRWELTVPDFRTLISDRNASFSGHLGDQAMGRE